MLHTPVSSDQQSSYEPADVCLTGQPSFKNNEKPLARLKPAFGSLIKTACGLRDSRGCLSVAISKGTVLDANGDVPQLDHAVEKNGQTWWIPDQERNASLVSFVMQRMNVVVLSEHGTLAHF